MVPRDEDGPRPNEPNAGRSSPAGPGTGDHESARSCETNFNMGKLAGMAKGDIPYDEAAAVAAATNINALSRSMSGNIAELTPGQMMEMTMKCHQFLFQAELTSNVANRTSDGIQQLFRQQS